MKSKWLHRHDLELVALVTAVLLAIAGFLVDGLGGTQGEGAGWRRIDTEKVRKLIDAGDLSDREALWYRPVTKDRGGKK